MVNPKRINRLIEALDQNIPFKILTKCIVRGVNKRNGDQWLNSHWRHFNCLQKKILSQQEEDSSVVRRKRQPSQLRTDKAFIIDGNAITVSSFTAEIEPWICSSKCCSLENMDCHYLYTIITLDIHHYLIKIKSIRHNC